MIDKAKLWRTILASWGFTLLGFFNLIFLALFASLLMMRVMGPEAFLVILMPTLAFMVLMFLGGEIVVNLMFRAKVPHPIDDKRFIEAADRIFKKAGVWVRPRIYVINLGDKPNAMAYGPGLPFLSAIGVTRPLIEMMDDDELETIIGHELGHVRCRDTGLLAIVGLLISLVDKLRHALHARNSAVTQSSVAFALGWIIYGIARAMTYISRFAISQEREYAADALGAYYHGDARPLMSALNKLHAWSKKESDQEKEAARPLFEDLMVSHPGLEQRVTSLQNIMTSNHGTKGVTT